MEFIVIVYFDITGLVIWMLAAAVIKLQAA